MCYVFASFDVINDASDRLKVVYSMEQCHVLSADIQLDTGFNVVVPKALDSA